MNGPEDFGYSFMVMSKSIPWVTCQWNSSPNLGMSIPRTEGQNGHEKPSNHSSISDPAGALPTEKWQLPSTSAKSLQSCPTLCDPIDGSPLGSPVPGILQARTLEWVAISFSNAWKWKVKVKSLSRVQLLATPWTAAHQAPLSMGFSRQEYWSEVPSPSPFVFLVHP